MCGQVSNMQPAIHAGQGQLCYPGVAVLEEELVQTASRETERLKAVPPEAPLLCRQQLVSSPPYLASGPLLLCNHAGRKAVMSIAHEGQWLSEPTHKTAEMSITESSANNNGKRTKHFQSPEVHVHLTHQTCATLPCMTFCMA